jgi:hypothetical protein
MKLKLKSTVHVQALTAVTDLPLSLHNRMLGRGFNLWNPGGLSLKQVPVAFPVKQAAKFSVLLNGKAGDLKNYLLQGVSPSREVLFSGKVSQPDGQSVTVTSSKQPEHFFHLQPVRITWQLVRPAGPALKIGTSPMEIFWLDKKHIPAKQLNTGIALEAIRQLSGLQQEMTRALSLHALRALAPADIVQQVFNQNPPRYDIKSGRSFFTSIHSWDNITLFYQAYLAAGNHPGDVLNCYDAAAVVQYLLQQNGVPTRYCFLKPFGYLRLTNLIGRGQCNNPFYSRSGQPVVPPASPYRTSFGNHAFVLLADTATIADACAGPHLGTDTKQDYIHAAIDDQFPNPPATRAGTVAEIGDYAGVQHINFMDSIYRLPDFPHVADFLGLPQLTGLSAQKELSGGIAGKWPGPLKCRDLKGWKLNYEEIIPGSEEVVKLWMLNKGDQSMMIKLHVISGDAALAENRFIAYGSLNQEQEHGLTAVPEQMGAYAVTDKNHPDTFYAWLHKNCVMTVMSNVTVPETRMLATWYYRWSARHSVATLKDRLPSEEMIHSVSKLQKGDYFHVSLNTLANLRLLVLPDQNTLSLVSDQDRQLVFRAVRSFKGELQMLILDQDTLLVAKRPLAVTID